jgi:hypothetical protein
MRQTDLQYRPTTDSTSLAQLIGKDSARHGIFQRTNQDVREGIMHHHWDVSVLPLSCFCIIVVTKKHHFFLYYCSWKLVLYVQYCIILRSTTVVLYICYDGRTVVLNVIVSSHNSKSTLYNEVVRTCWNENGVPVHGTRNVLLLQYRISEVPVNSTS